MTPLRKHRPGAAPSLDHVGAVSYIRQSKRREDDSQASPVAQRERCASLIASKGGATRATWKLQDVLDGRTQVVVRAGRRVPTLPAGHGLLFCDVCGSVMVTDRRAGELYYKCNRAGGVVPGHGGLVIGQDAADSETAGRVWARLMAMDPADPEDLEWVAEASRRFARPQDTSQRDAERASVRVELEHVRESRRILHVYRLAGVHADETGAQMFRESMARLAAHEERTAERLAELEATGNRSIQMPNEWTSVDGDPIGEGSTWAAWDPEKKREFLALFIDSVRIAKSVGRGRNANTRDRVIVRWAESPEPAAA
ncbi:zinc ribbon domain-containing protein [Streptomyces sp. NPDC057250]|uniref:zinc ribbon domain-containing protein n=1 Tax=unclassified Streptomyces TaxID=2593676 RepID=UPI0036352889